MSPAAMGEQPKASTCRDYRACSESLQSTELLPPTRYVKAFEANMNRRTWLQNQPLGTSEKGTALGSIYRSTSSASAETLSQMQNLVFKKKLPTKTRDPSNESLQATQMLV